MTAQIVATARTSINVLIKISWGLSYPNIGLKQGKNINWELKVVDSLTFSEKYGIKMLTMGKDFVTIVKVSAKYLFLKV